MNPIVKLDVIGFVDLNDVGEVLIGKSWVLSVSRVESRTCSTTLLWTNICHSLALASFDDHIRRILFHYLVGVDFLVHVF